MQSVIWSPCLIILFTIAGISIRCTFAQELPNQVLLLGPPTSPILVMRWRVNLTDLVLELEAQTRGWIAFGLSPDGNMDSSDVVFTWVDPGSLSVYAQDRFIIANPSTLTVNLTLDRTQNWQRLGGRQNATHTLIRTTRKLISSDPNDYSFLDATKRLIYAVADTAPNRATGEIVMHSARGNMVYTGFQSAVRALQTTLTSSTMSTLSPLDVVRVGITPELLTTSTPNSSTSSRNTVLTNPVRIAPSTSATTTTSATRSPVTTLRPPTSTPRTSPRTSSPARSTTKAALAPARPMIMNQPTAQRNTPSSQDLSLPTNSGFPNPYSVYPEDPLGATLLATLPTTGVMYQPNFSPDFFPPSFSPTTTSTTTPTNRAVPNPSVQRDSANGEAFYVQWTTRPPFPFTSTDAYTFDNRPSEESALNGGTITMDGTSSEVPNTGTPNTEIDIAYDELSTTTTPLTSRMSSEAIPPLTGPFATDPLPQGPVSLLSFSAAGPNLTANVLGVPVTIPLGHIDPETLNMPLQDLQGGGATTAKILQALTQMWGIIGQLVTGKSVSVSNTHNDVGH